MKYLILFIGLTLSLVAWNQELTGKVYTETEGKEEVLVGAQLMWVKSKEGGTTDIDGKFHIKPSNSFPDTLIVSFVGYKTLKIHFNKKPKDAIDIKLESGNILNEIVVDAGDDKYLSTMDPIGFERINQGELKKAACCNLSEAFETNASVDVSITDAVSGAKKIQMLGLDGVYTQMQFENFPILRGLSSS